MIVWGGTDLPSKMTRMRKLLIGLGVLLVTLDLAAQIDSTVNRKVLDSVIIQAYLTQNIVRQLPAVTGLFLTGGKKSELIDLQALATALPNKTARQIFARVPGVFVYDMDGTGNQINIASRGLDPHRGWEFNIRKDGVITNSDMYGYPASHYSMPLESISKIELIRGTGSLQYGAQFGGMLNYVSKKGDSSRPVSFENITTAGSYGLLSSYLAAGGQIKKFTYYTYVYRKTRKGYRHGEETDSEAQSLRLSYRFNSKWSILFDWSRSRYRYKMAGQLNDRQFHLNPRQATRTRNYFSPDIQVPSVQLNWNLSEYTKFQLLSSAVLGRRNSILFDRPADVADTVNSLTGNFNNRQIDIDRFHSFSYELRLLHQYSLFGRRHHLATGLQLMHNRLHRTQQGVGNTGSDYDLTRILPGWGRDMEFVTRNLAFFAENSWQIGNRLHLNTGVRVEQGKTDMSGKLTYYPDDDFPVTIHHQFPLLGVQFYYNAGTAGELYGGWSQAYRPVLFKDLVPGSLYEKVDPSMKDAYGDNYELGWRGFFRFLRWDITAFVVNYRNRFGMLAQSDQSGNLILYRTNIGNSVSKGLEVLLQADWSLGQRSALSLFNSTSFMDARYKKAVLRSGLANKDIAGNYVESVPQLISRNGINFRKGIISAGLLYSYTSGSYADALNTKVPPEATGAVGWVPAYGVLDMNASCRIADGVDIRATLNNAFNKSYFTKRPSFYPGPGIWPSDGRNWSLSLTVRW